MEIHGTTIAEVWLRACEHVAAKPKWEDNTVILRVASPVRMRARDRSAATSLDSFLRHHERFPNHTVAETIFPGYEYMRRGSDGVFKEYPDKIYPKMKKHSTRGWGRYAERLVRRKRPDGTVWNPLEKTIQKLINFSKRNAFEIAVSDIAVEDEEESATIALYNDNADGKISMGLPCLSHLSFHIVEGNRLQLTALYRSHYYVQRLYGNLLGLARLQDFVAQLAGLKTGELVCHSTFAKLETGGKDAPWKKQDIKDLLHTVRTEFDQQSEPDGALQQGAV